MKTKITDLIIMPVARRDGRRYAQTIATIVVTIDDAITIAAKIVDNPRRGIVIKWPESFGFTAPEERRSIDNRILATYVINHCIDDTGSTF